MLPVSPGLDWALLSQSRYEHLKGHRITHLDMYVFLSRSIILLHSDTAPLAMHSIDSA